MTKESLPAEDSDGHSQRRRRVYKLNIFLTSRQSDPPNTHILWGGRGGYFVAHRQAAFLPESSPVSDGAHQHKCNAFFYSLVVLVAVVLVL